MVIMGVGVEVWIGGCVCAYLARGEGGGEGPGVGGVEEDGDGEEGEEEEGGGVALLLLVVGLHCMQFIGAFWAFNNTICVMMELVLFLCC
jgi:hypothetical protein